MLEKNSILRVIYLYSFAMVGLVLLVIGGVGFIDMGLKTFVFTQAEADEKLNYAMPTYPPCFMEAKISSAAAVKGEVTLTQEEYDQVKYSIQDYKAWQERQKGVDYITSRRHRDASLNLSLIIVGLPVYLYHWLVIRKEAKKTA